jgi:HD superfamily phosphohydrolase
LHDIAHTYFGHELEELDPRTFSHGDLVKDLIENCKVQDIKGRSLHDVIEGGEYDEWNCKDKDIIDILKRKNMRLMLLSDIIDGPMDADKLDYLLRDGVNCNVAYPAGIDVDRVIRCLSVVPVDDGRQTYLRLGIKEKGIAASEMFTVARHKMYQSVYLHHTVRCIKGMALTALSKAYRNMKDKLPGNNLLGFGNPITKLYSAHIMGSSIADYMDIAVRKSNIEKIMEMWKIIKDGELEMFLKFNDTDPSLTFFYGFMDDEDRELFAGAINRKLYIRLAEMQMADAEEGEYKSLEESMNWKNREELCKKISKRLIQAIERKLTDNDRLRITLGIDENRNQLLRYNDIKHVVVVDLPSRNLGIGGEAPHVLGDISRKRGLIRNQSSRGYAKGHIWNKGMSTMMREIKCARVFVMREFYNYVQSCLDNYDVKSVIKEEILFWN